MSELLSLPDGFKMLAHVPPGAGPDTPVLVAVHGISRNAREHLDTFAAALGDRCAVLAPRFNEAQFPSYQRLGIGRDEPRADLVFEAALDQMAASAGLSTARMHMFGFSGGAQFAQRYAMLRPARVASLQLASAGWYTFFDAGVPWPRGCRTTDPAGRKILANEAFFHRIPCHVYVGENDTERDSALRAGPKIDAQQGETRLTRAHAWVAHLTARRGPLRAPPSFTALHGCGHDFAAACAADGGLLVRSVARAALSPDLPAHATA
jgi:pimeloyl-ACP methyl ester carboxylesterase